MANTPSSTTASLETPPNRGRYLVAGAALILAAGGAVYVATQTDAERLEDTALQEVAAATTTTPNTTNVPDSVAIEGPLPLKTYALNTPLEAPEFAPRPDREWFNSAPLTDADLDGRVVLFDFWTFSCHNCKATIPHLREIHKRYERDGLLLIGVHAAEFEFEKEPAAIEAAIADLGVTWPVVNDPEREVWRDHKTRFWPTQDLYDGDGTLRYAHKGEGRYEEIEDYVRDVLGVDPASPRADEPSET